MGNPPFWHNSPVKCRNAAKVRGAGKERHKRTEKSPGPGECAGVPPGRTRLRARTARGGASAAGGESEPPCSTAWFPETGYPADAGLKTRLRLVPVSTYPVFLAPGGNRKPLFIPSYRIHGGFSRRERLKVPAALHPQGLPTQEGPPVRGGCLLALESRLLNWEGGGRIKANGPQKYYRQFAESVGSGGLSFLQILLFLILFCRLQSHVLFSRSHPDNWHFPRPSKSVFLHQGKEACNQGTWPPPRRWASPRLAPRQRASCGNLSPSRSLVTEFKEILPKYKDPGSGRSLGVSRSQYPPARSA